MYKPTIGILHYTSPPIVGGVEAVIQATAELFAAHSYQVRVYAGRGRPFHPQIPLNLIPELDSKYPTLLQINEELQEGIVSARFEQLQGQIHSILKGELADLDVCIVHNALSLHFNLPLTAALHAINEEQGKPRLIGWCHDLSWMNPLYIPLMREAFPWTLLKRPWKGVTYAVVSKQRLEQLAALFGVESKRLHFVPNGVHPARFLKLGATTKRIVENHHLLSQDLVLLLPARITKRKNIELAIKVMAAIKSLGYRAKMLITGPPGPHNVRSTDYLESLRSLRHDLGLTAEVVFLCEEKDARGRPLAVSDRVMSDLFALADLLFFPSAQEGFGIPILEAGLVRLPVFCSDIAPFKEVGQNDVYYFALNDDPKAIAERLITFVKDDQSQRLSKRVRQGYNWSVIFRERIEPLVREGYCATEER
ncbi:MAG: glycosyltransferase family 4 protein [Chloroflexi bacterium]|nr:glycosyltransferase family 4 protein [Chloroflexota bacterium]MCL5074754.1 glycosyltransferase family 4 protein [Chloroflexota bacterium]